MTEPRYPRAITPAGHVEPVPRRIRAELAGRTVLDTMAALYLWEWPFYPQYLIPAGDVDPDVLSSGSAREARPFGSAVSVELRVGDTVRPGAGRRYVDAPDPRLIDTVHLDWDAVDAWYEEAEQVFVHPRSPYVRVDALRSRRRVRVSLDGVTLAQSDAPVTVFETGLPTRHYLERGAVDFSHLTLSETVTECPYKGRTSATWSVVLGGRVHPDLAWSYHFPTRQLEPIAGLVAFYDERVDVEIDGDPVERPHTHFAK